MDETNEQRAITFRYEEPRQRCKYKCVVCGESEKSIYYLLNNRCFDCLYKPNVRNNLLYIKEIKQEKIYKN